MDYYQVLGVSKSATEQEVKSSYRRLALQYHPDKNPSPEAKSKFQELTHAYSILIDPKKRYNYDNGIGEEGEIDLDDLMAFFDPDFFREMGFPSGMEFLGPLFAMGMFAEIHKGSSSGESMDDDEMKEFYEFVESNIEMNDGKFQCKICNKKFNKKDNAIKHVGNEHHEASASEDEEVRKIEN